MNVESNEGVATLDIDSCLLTNNSAGVIEETILGGPGAASISNCTISRNSIAFDISGGGAIFSRGNNTIIGNGPNVNPLAVLTPLTAQ
jgi:hypothetical protein